MKFQEFQSIVDVDESPGFFRFSSLSVGAFKEYSLDWNSCRMHESSC